MNQRLSLRMPRKARGKRLALAAAVIAAAVLAAAVLAAAVLAAAVRATAAAAAVIHLTSPTAVLAQALAAA